MPRPNTSVDGLGTLMSDGEAVKLPLVDCCFSVIRIREAGVAGGWPVESFEFSCWVMKGVPFAETGFGGGRIARLCCAEAEEGWDVTETPVDDFDCGTFAASSEELPLVAIREDVLTGCAALRFRVEAAGGFDSEDTESFLLVFRGLSLADISSS